jgi:uncharacterized protein with HEPN domain
MSEHITDNYLIEFEVLGETINELMAITVNKYPEKCKELRECRNNLRIENIEEVKELRELYGSALARIKKGIITLEEFANAGGKNDRFK